MASSSSGNASPPKNSVGVLKALPQLQALWSQLALHDAALRCVRGLLPADLAAHCHICIVDAAKHRLLVYMDHAVWATRVRFEMPGLLAGLQAGGVVAGVEVPRVLRGIRLGVVRVQVPLVGLAGGGVVEAVSEVEVRPDGVDDLEWALMRLERRIKQSRPRARRPA